MSGPDQSMAGRAAISRGELAGLAHARGKCAFVRKSDHGYQRQTDKEPFQTSSLDTPPHGIVT